MLVPVLNATFRFVMPERIGTIILSALVAHTGWHWMIDRGERLLQFRVVWPALTAAFLATAVRWAMVTVVASGAAWAIYGLAQRTIRAREGSRQLTVDS
jgi:hypothetical protein